MAHQLLTLAETANRLRKTEAGLRWMIHRDTAPPSAMIGGRRYFRERDVDEYIDRAFESQR